MTINTTHNPNIITQDTAADMILNSGGRIFSVKFVKKNGEVRKMTCRLHVSKHVKGVGRSFTPSDYDLVGAFDIQADGHRMINLKTVFELTSEGVRYDVE